MFGYIAYMHFPNEKRLKLNPKVEKCIFIKYSLEQKKYKCFNPSTWKLQEVKNGNVSSNVEQESQLINGPQESSISGSSNTPQKGILRSSNIIHDNFLTLYMIVVKHHLEILM